MQAVAVAIAMVVAFAGCRAGPWLHPWVVAQAYDTAARCVIASVVRVMRYICPLLPAVALQVVLRMRDGFVWRAPNAVWIGPTRWGRLTAPCPAVAPGSEPAALADAPPGLGADPAAGRKAAAAGRGLAAKGSLELRLELHGVEPDPAGTCGAGGGATVLPLPPRPWR